MLTRRWVGAPKKRRTEGGGAERERETGAGNGGKQPGRTGAYSADLSGASANVSVSAGRTRVRTRPISSRKLQAAPVPSYFFSFTRLAPVARRFYWQSRRLRSRARRDNAGVPSGGFRVAPKRRLPVGQPRVPAWKKKRCREGAEVHDRAPCIRLIMERRCCVLAYDDKKEFRLRIKKHYLSLIITKTREKF